MKFFWPVLCAECLALMVIFVMEERRGRFALSVFLKGTASLCFVILGFLAKRFCSDASLAGYVMTGLILGAIADVLLNLRFVFVKTGSVFFLGGTAVFLAGHIFYLAALLPRSPNPWLWLAVGAIFTVLVMFWIFVRITAKPAFKVFGVFYIGAVMMMACVAFGNLLAMPGAHTAVFAAGAVSFLVSDIVLILNTFGKESKFYLRMTNLTLYYLGQLAIAISLSLI